MHLRRCGCVYIYSTNQYIFFQLFKYKHECKSYFIIGMNAVYFLLGKTNDEAYFNLLIIIKVKIKSR